MFKSARGRLENESDIESESENDDDGQSDNDYDGK